MLSHTEIKLFMKMFRACKNRSFDNKNITFEVTGTLIILISCLFMNGGAGGSITEVNERNSPNKIVMNTVIASATSGLTLELINQYYNQTN